MIAKMTSKNQLTPVRMQRADAVRSKLNALGISDADISDAVKWARRDPPN